VPKILVIRGGAIGDFILTLPVLAALRRQFPNARLELLGYPHIARLAVAGGLADDVRSIDARPLAGFFGSGPLDPALQDYFAEFPIILSYLYDPDRTFQTNVLQSCHGQFIAGPHRPDDTKDQHATEVFLEPLQRLAIFDADPVPRLTIPAATLDPRPKLLAFHPGSGSERKNWPMANWIALTRELAQQTDASLLIVGGEAETDKLSRIAAAFPRPAAEVAFNWPLAKLAERLAGCSAFVGHDSGITHLAAALGLRTVALWADTPEAVWRPRGDHVTVLRHASGLEKLTLTQVLEATRALVPD
jgi:ADP-heptose:LPS heptosyltransferase